jgi:SH3 domain-containing YSC84-like protein 1
VIMRKLGVMVVMCMAAAAFFASAASTRSDNVARIQRSAEVFHEIMATPDRAIPNRLLSSARCVAIIPGEKQVAFMVGGKHGIGLVSCRHANGWSAPAFLSVGGGSYGFQIGGSSTDIVMVFRNCNGLDRLLSDKFRVGAGPAAAAGPVGRNASAGTDIKLPAEILTYAQSHGAFAGVRLNGAVAQPDHDGDAALYGPNAGTRQILSGNVAIPGAARSLVHELSRYSAGAQSLRFPPETACILVMPFALTCPTV